MAAKDYQTVARQHSAPGAFPYYRIAKTGVSHVAGTIRHNHGRCRFGLFHPHLHQNRHRLQHCLIKRFT